MNVGELRKLIEGVDDDLLVTILSPGMGGLTEATVAYREEIGGLDHRSSYEKVNCLILIKGQAEHMKSQGIDVVDAAKALVRPPSGDEHVSYAVDAMATHLDKWLDNCDPAEAYDKLIEVWKELRELA